MSDTALFWLTLVSAVGCGLIGGVFFAFSTFVMPALGRLPAPQGLAAMQSINVTALRPAFMMALFGTALLCLALASIATLRWGAPECGYLLVGSILYLAGTILVTMLFNVPRNMRLEAARPEADNIIFWADYLRTWTAWNHVRTVTSLAASVMLTLGLGTLSRFEIIPHFLTHQG